MTNPNPSHAVVSGSGDSFYHAVFIETNLGTHLVLAVSDTETVSDLKNKIVREHPILFPNYGEIRVNAVKVKRRGHFYWLCDSIPVSTAFIGIRKNWFLLVESSSSMDTKFGHQPNPLAMYPPNCKGDLKIVPHQRSVIDPEVPSSSLHRKHIDVVTSQVSPCAISKESDHWEQGANVTYEVNAIGSSSVVVKETNHLEQGAELSNRKNDDGRIAQILEAAGMDVNETSHENINDTVAREHAGEETVGKIKHANTASASLEATGTGEHKKRMKRKRSTKTINAVDQNPVVPDTEPVEGFAGGFSEPQKDINGIEVGDKCEIGDNHASQDGGQEEDIVAAQARSGKEYVNGVGLMNDIEEKEASHDRKDYTKKKAKKRRISDEKNSLKTEIKGSDPTSKDLSYIDDITGNQVSDEYERRNNVSQEGGDELAIATHVNSGEEYLIGTATLNSIEEKQARDNKQYNTNKQNKRKQSREVENLLNTEAKHSDLAGKNLMPAEDIVVNQVVDIHERGIDKVSSGEGEKAVVAGHAKSDQEHVDGTGSIDHIKEKEASYSNKRVASENCEIVNNNASQGQEEEIVSGHVKSGVEDGDKIGSMDSIKEMETSNNINDYAKKKNKKKRHHKERLLNIELKDPDFASKNLLNAEDVTSHHVGDKCEREGIIVSGEEGKEIVVASVKSCQEHVDGIGLLDHIKAKEASDNNKREVSDRCEIGNNNVSQEGQEKETVAGHVKSGVENVNEIGLMDSIKEASNSIQDHTKKKTKKKRHHKENKESKDPDFSSKNLLNAEDITANQVGDKCVRGGIILSAKEGKETVVASSMKSGQEQVVEAGSLDHKKEKATLDIHEDHAKKKTKKTRSREKKISLNTEVAVNAADGKSGNDQGQVLESLDHIKEIREDKLGTDDAMDKKKKKSRSSKKEELLHVGTSHPGSNSGRPLYAKNDISALDSSVVMAKEGKAETATPMSSSIVPRSEIERASVDTDQAHTKVNVANSVSSLKPSHEGNTNGSPSQAVAKLDAPLDDTKKKAGHHADVLGESGEINFRDYFVSGQQKRKTELNSNAPSAAESFDSKGSRIMKRGNKHRLGVDRYCLAARKSNDGNNGETITRPERKKSLLDTSNAIFKEDSTGSSEGPHGVEDSDGSTRTPSDNILSDYSDGDSLEYENTSKRDGDGKDVKKSHFIEAKNLSMEAIIRSSSRYKKAKLAASLSQHDDMDSEHPEFVPDSQANV